MASRRSSRPAPPSSPRSEGRARKGARAEPLAARTSRSRGAGRRAQKPATTALDPLAYARSVIETETRAVAALGSRLGPSFAEAVARILACRGRVVVTGMGKPGFIAQKLSATFASTGTPSLYLHPAEALHGDLGRVVRDDLVLALSNSGRTEEVVRLAGPVKRIGAALVALVGDASSPLAKAADVVIDIGDVAEACPLGLVPTASSMVLLALGDALAMTVLKQRPFGNEEYALFHPGGSLGRSVMRVGDVMRKQEANPVVAASAPLSRAVHVMTTTPGRPGATSVVDAAGRLVGIFTDGDLRRRIDEGASLACTIGAVMGRKPRTVRPHELVLDAARLLREARIDQVPVVDDDGRPVGLLDVQDLLAVRMLG